MVCTYCGTKLFEKDRLCPNCGGVIDFQEKNKTNNSKECLHLNVWQTSGSVLCRDCKNWFLESEL
jgi:hypothetical protein